MPSAYYRLGETAGQTAHDSSGKAYDGTFGTGITLGAAGALGGDSDTAYQFTNGLVGVVVPQSTGILGQYVLGIDVANTTPPQITANTLPSQGTTSNGVIDRFTLNFSEDMNAATVNTTANYDLRAAGPDGKFGTADDIVYHVSSPTYTSGPAASYLVSDGPLQPGNYQLTLSSALTDRTGNPLAPYTLNFTVAGVAPYTLENRNSHTLATATPLAASNGLPDGTFTPGTPFPMSGTQLYYAATARLRGAGQPLDLVTANNSSTTISVAAGQRRRHLPDARHLHRRQQSHRRGHRRSHRRRQARHRRRQLRQRHRLCPHRQRRRHFPGNCRHLQCRLRSPAAWPSPIWTAKTATTSWSPTGTATMSACCWARATARWPPPSTITSATAPAMCSSPISTPTASSTSSLPNYSDNTVSVLPGNGDGTFGTQVVYPAGTGNPIDVVALDLNGDHKLDLATSNVNGSTVSVLLNQGTPNTAYSASTFAAPVGYNAGGSSPYHIVAADLNGDGKMDLAIAGYGSNQVGVLISNGDGTLQTAQSYSVSGNPLGITAGDFNGDGIMDLATANNTGNSATILLGNAGKPLASDSVSGLSFRLRSRQSPQHFGDRLFQLVRHRRRHRLLGVRNAGQSVARAVCTTRSTTPAAVL